MQSNSVNKGIFHFLGARIWVHMPVYRYKNPSGYFTAYISPSSSVAWYIEVILATIKGYLRYKIIFCHKVALDV